MMPNSNIREAILLVEDDLATRSTTEKILSQAGFQVFSAGSESEALRLWTRHARQIGILFTDMMIPFCTTGASLASKLKQVKPDLKIIYTSGFTSDIVTEEPVVEEGLFLQKPYSAGALLDAMIDCMSFPIVPREQAAV